MTDIKDKCEKLAEKLSAISNTTTDDGVCEHAAAIIRKVPRLLRASYAVQDRGLFATGDYLSSASDGVFKAIDNINATPAPRKVSVDAVAEKLCSDAGFNWDAKDFTETSGGETPDEQREYYRSLATSSIRACGCEPEEENKS